MNERIRDLSEQAEKYADDNFRGEPTWSEAFESKFAELIVNDCLDIVDKEVSGMVGVHAMRKIEEHFGVE